MVLFTCLKALGGSSGWTCGAVQHGAFHIVPECRIVRKISGNSSEEDKSEAGKLLKAGHHKTNLHVCDLTSAGQLRCAQSDFMCVCMFKNLQVVGCLSRMSPMRRIFYQLPHIHQPVLLLLVFTTFLLRSHDKNVFGISDIVFIGPSHQQIVREMLAVQTAWFHHANSCILHRTALSQCTSLCEPSPC